ncbi:hypothetical protein BDF19DRAFT_443090 [Syncephalis fuscata]|nr:hypothetical protein BDF19DRAFT_443090 [Syncephalis fuscata]
MADLDKYYENREWEKNATRLYGIPLHPLGELNIYDVILRNHNGQKPTKALIRARLSGFYLQFIINLAIAIIFCYNLRKTIRAVRYDSKSLAGWCCLLTSLLGVSLTATCAVILLSDTLGCRTFVWSGIWIITISVFINSIVVLQRAYLALRRNRWILTIGVLSILPQLGSGINSMIYSPAVTADAVGCVVDYPPIVSWIWVATTTPFGSDAWRRLARQGIQTMCLVVLCNLICISFLLTSSFGGFSEYFFSIDWVITSTILANYCVNVHTKSISRTSVNNSNMNGSVNTGITPTITTYHDRFAQTFFLILRSYLL